MKKIIALLFMLLAGCAPTTADQLRVDHSGVYSFTVDENLQSVYERTLFHSLNCFQKSVTDNNTKVHGDRDVGGTRYSISIKNVHAFSADILFAIDITEIGADKTAVTVYYSLNQYEADARTVEDWIKKDSDDCRAAIKMRCAC